MLIITYLAGLNSGHVGCSGRCGSKYKNRCLRSAEVKIMSLSCDEIFHFFDGAEAVDACRLNFLRFPNLLPARKTCSLAAVLLLLNLQCENLEKCFRFMKWKKVR